MISRSVLAGTLLVAALAVALGEPPYPTNAAAACAFGSANLASTVDVATGTTPQGIALADIDGDGKSDILVTNLGDNTISVLRNSSTNGTISFDTKVDFAAGTTPALVGVGDIDGDGKPDVVATNQGDSTVSVLRNTSTSGTLSLTSQVTFATGSSPLGLALGDIDGDGKLDVVTFNTTAASVSVLRNTSTSGAISMASKVDFGAGSCALR